MPTIFQRAGICPSKSDIEIGVEKYFSGSETISSQQLYDRVSQGFYDVFRTHSFIFEYLTTPFFMALLIPTLISGIWIGIKKQDQHINALVSLNVALMLVLSIRLLDRSHISPWYGPILVSIATCLLVSVVSNAGIIVRIHSRLTHFASGILLVALLFLISADGERNDMMAAKGDAARQLTGMHNLLLSQIDIATECFGGIGWELDANWHLQSLIINLLAKS